MADSQTWRWLLDIHRRMDIVVEAVDEKLTPLLPPLGSRAAVGVRRLMHPSTTERLRDALLGSMRNLTQEVVGVGAFRFTCTPIVVVGRAIGAVVAAEEESATAGARAPDRLERVGSWLAGLIETHLANAPVDDPTELRQLSSLYQLFEQQIATGSESAVVRGFVEAVAVWEDLDCRAYVADLAGCFHLAVSLPGSDPAQVPVTIVPDAPSRPGISRPSAGDRKRLGFEEGTIIMTPSAASTGAQWVIVASLPPDARRTARVALYVDVLAQALTNASAVKEARLTWALTQHLLLSDSPQAAMHAVTAELTRATGDVSCFSLFRSDGLAVLTVGDVSQLLVRPTPASTPRRLVVPVATPAPFWALIGMQKRDDGTFNRGDEHLLQTTAALVSTWLKPVVGPLAAAAERRATRQTFDEIVAQYDSEPAILHDLSMIIISAGDAVAPVPLLRGWVNELRQQLRPTDLVGSLLSGDVGVLLLYTADDGAQVVARRLRRLLTETSPHDLRSNAKVGAATRQRGSTLGESLVAQAKARATILQAGVN